MILTSSQNQYTTRHFVFIVQRPSESKRISLHFAARWASSHAAFSAIRKKRRRVPRARTIPLSCIETFSVRLRVILWSLCETNEHCFEIHSRFLRRTEPICLDKDYRSSKYIETSAYFREIWRKPCHERLLLFVSFFPVLIQSDHDVVFAKCYVLLVKREREKRRSRNHFLSTSRYEVFLTGNRLSCIHTKSVTWYITRHSDRAQDHWTEPQHAIG